MNDLLVHPGMVRIAGFTKSEFQCHPNMQSHTELTQKNTGCVQAFAPKLYDFVMGVLGHIQKEDKSLKYPYQDHPFSTITFNIGPKVITIPHWDRWDLVGGWCSVTSLGNYDPTKGGHLIFWDLGLAIQFPPYSTIFFPSALLCHSNTEIQPEEQRSSVTQFNSSGLFRWVAFDSSLKEGREQSGKSWWDKPVGMFRKVFGKSAPKS